MRITQNAEPNRSVKAELSKNSSRPSIPISTIEIMVIAVATGGYALDLAYQIKIASGSENQPPDNQFLEKSVVALVSQLG